MLGCNVGVPQAAAQAATLAEWRAAAWRPSESCRLTVMMHVTVNTLARMPVRCAGGRLGKLTLAEVAGGSVAAAATAAGSSTAGRAGGAALRQRLAAAAARRAGAAAHVPARTGAAEAACMLCMQIEDGGALRIRTTDCCRSVQARAFIWYMTSAGDCSPPVKVKTLVATPDHAQLATVLRRLAPVIRGARRCQASASMCTAQEAVGSPCGWPSRRTSPGPQ